MTLVEAAIASTIIATVLIAAAAGFGASLKGVDRSKSISRATVFLETVLEDLSAQDYDALLALNGNQFFDQTNAADSKYGVTLTVFQAQLDLLQLRVVVRDLDTNDVIGSVTTQRCRR
ncbi:MAG: hypothetical protein IT453_00190 [Planctomycetes bacterium]|nr:hypothetical protein [Planctomycetota bacterium]